MTETWRLFVALHPPADALAELAAAVDAVRPGAPPGLRWTRPETWHLTVAFLGAVPTSAVPALEAELAHVARRRHLPGPQARRDGGRIRLRIAGAGRFGDRVLWSAVRDADAGAAADAAPDARPSPALLALRALAGATARRAGRAGITVDAAPFKAHLTLARARDGADLRRCVEALREFAGRPWTADELCLVRSRLGAGPDGGPAYETVGAWRLGPDGSVPHQAGPSDPNAGPG